MTLVDRLEPGAGTSLGNAGLIQIDSCVPIATPGVLAEVPKMLLDPEGPLVIRWRYLLQIAPWLTRFVLASRPGRVEALSLALMALLDQADAAYRPLITDAGADDLMRPTGELRVYRTEASWRAAKSAIDLRRRRGAKLEILDADAVRQLEPALSQEVKYGVYSPDCRSVADPLTLTTRLAQAFVRGGGTVLRAEVTDIEIADGGARALITDGGRHETDALVIAAGAYSKPWAAKFGVRVPLDTERGYHLMLPDPGVDLRVPVLAGDRRFAIVPMTGGVRLAGTTEFAGLHAPPFWRRADMLGPMAQQLVPGLRIEGGERWMGYRPALPDSVAVIGPAPTARAVFLAFGHGHLGLTLGAITGRLIADLAAGRDPGLDMTPYRADRF